MTESVTYIVQRLVSLASLFCLLSLLLFIKGILSERLHLRYSFYAGSALTALLGFFTKETAYTTPFLILMVYFFFFSRRMAFKHLSGVILLIMMLLLVSVLVFIALRSGKYFSPVPPREGHPYIITPLHYYYTQINVLVTYLRLIILPVNQTLDYNYPMVTRLGDLHVLINLAGLLLLLITALWQFTRDRLVSFGIFWFFITIAPQCLVPRSNFIFEHRAYLSAFGIILILVLLVYYLFAWISLNTLKKDVAAARLMTVAGCVLLLQCFVFGWMTWDRNKVWKDEYSLWSDCLLKSPGSARAMVNLGAEQASRQEYLPALENFDRAIIIFPLYLQAWNSRAAVRINLGEDEKAVEELNFVLQQKPAFLDALINRGIALRNLKRYEASISDFNVALSINPNRSDTYFQRGLSFWMAGRNDGALADISQAAKMNNQDAIGFLQRYLR